MNRPRFKLLIPYLTVVAVAAVTCVFWLALQNQEHAAIEREVKHEAAVIRSKFESDLAYRVAVLERMAARWSERGAPPREEWEADAARYVEDFHDFQAIEWVDPSYHVRWIVPLLGNEQAQDLNLAFEPHRYAALERARNRRTPTMTRPIDLVQGGKGLLVYCPIQRGTVFEGFILGVYRIDKLLSKVHETVSQNLYHAQIHVGDHLIYTQNQESPQNQWTQQTTAPLYSVPWRYTLSPSPRLLNQLRSPLPTVTLLAGLVLGPLLFVMTRLSQKIRNRSVSVAKTNQQLHDQIAERKSIENTLRDSEQRSRAIFETVPTAVVMIDGQGMIQSINPAGVRIFGYSATEVIGQNVKTLMPSPYHEQHDGYLANYKKTGQKKIIGIGREVVGRRKDGTTFPMQLSVGEFLCNGRSFFTGVAEDISTRKQAQDAMWLARQRLELAVDGTSDGLWDWNTVTNEVWYAPRFKELLGYTDNGDDFPGVLDTFSDHLHPEDRDPTFEAMRQHLKNNQPYDAEFRLRTQEGEYRWFRARGIAVRDDAGKAVRMAGSIRDITIRKQADRVLKQHMEDLADAKDDIEAQAIELAIKTQELELAREQAESAAKTKSEFLANMNHEIRTPMTAILGYADLLTDPNQPQEEAKSAIDTIHRNGQHLLTIINDILDLSKLEADKMSVERIDCSPVEIALEVISLMHDRAFGKNLRLEIELSGPVPKTIRTDPTRLRQILINLVGNAIKFTDQGDVRLVLKMADNPGLTEPLLTFEVIDSGIGMTKEQQENLFQAFSQADTSTTRKFGGTGLGLMISKRLTKIMGGDITAACKPGEGCAFIVTIATGPLDGVAMIDSLTETKTEGKPTPTAPTGDAPPLDGRILLAEDGPDNQRLISFVLKKAGAHVDVAGDGLIAYEKATAAWQAQEPYDMILMDMQMPKMDGYETTAKLRQEGYKGPIIALTAHAMAEDRQRCLDAGCDEYATKPIDKTKLISLIWQFMQRSPQNAGV